MSDLGGHVADDAIEHLGDPAPAAGRPVPGLPDLELADRPLAERPIGMRETGRYPQHAHRVRVRRVAPGQWRAALRTDAADEHVGVFPTQREALMRGITAARFVAAGIPWRAAS